MQKISKKTIGFILVIILCISMIPMSAMATGNEPAPDPDGNIIEEQITEETGDKISDIRDDELDDGNTADEVIVGKMDTAADTQADGIQPEYTKVVDKPLVEVVFSYYDEASNQGAASVTDYSIASAYSYYALAMASDAGITIAANKYPGIVPVSTDASRFRVLLNKGTDTEQDITGMASYDAASGLVSLPQEYMGHAITIEWYCPASETTSVPVKVTIGTYMNGAFETTEQDLSLASNIGTVAVPVSAADTLVVSQNGIDLPEGSYSVSDGTLNIATSPLGGDITVTAYAAAVMAMGSGMTTMGTSVSQVVHTRSSEQIFYGYYTSFYTANGNTAFCLDPTVSGLNAGTYNVSGFLQRGTGYDDLIKAAWYLYGGPGYNSVKSNLFGDPDSMTAYGLCHAAVAYMWMDNPAAFMGLDSGTIQHLQNLIAAVNAQAMPPSGFDVLLYNVGSSTNQSLMSWDYTPTGNLEIQKVSGNTDMTDNNECYSLEGAVFGIYNGSNERIGTIITDANGKGRLEGIDAGQTGLYILEEDPPSGYAENKTKIPFEIASGQTTTKEIKNYPQGDPADIMLYKLDDDTGEGVAEGNASLAGAQFTIKYYKGHYPTESDLVGKTPARTWIVETDEDGFAMLDSISLVSGDPFYYDSTGKKITIPLGTITVQETKAPDKGYLINNELFIRIVPAEGKLEGVTTYNAPKVPDKVIRGGVSILKLDGDLLRPGQAQGSATLAGATFNIINRSANAVVVDGKKYNPGQIVYTAKTNSDGVFSTPNANFLPYGRYEISEPEDGAPNGYLNTGKISQIFDIEKHGFMVELKTGDTAISNEVKRGAVVVYKFDNEIDRNESQGSATLMGAQFQVINLNNNPVVVDDVEYQKNEVVYTLTTDEDGHAATPDRYLPVGDYKILEVSPPLEGYLATGVLSRTFTLSEDGEIKEMTTSDTAIKNDIIRGDLRGTKISDGDGKRLANIPFSITSLTTGESHIIVTDKNGEFNTASSWNPHSQNTNAGTSDGDGIWFGELWTLNDDVGALIYDDYLIEELRCENNEDRELLSFEVSVYRHDHVIDLGTLTNDYTQVPEIFTTALDAETMANDAFVSEISTIRDTLYYSGLKVGTEYVARGWLMDKETGEPLLIDDEKITAEKKFKALTESGTVTMDFTFNSLALKGKSVVVFEAIELDGKEIAVHFEFDSAEQTITFKDPVLGTTATGSASEKELDIAEKTVIRDVIAYEGLVKNQTYDLRGVLMDKATGEPLLVNGEQVVVEKSFVAKEESGTVEMEFTLDSLDLKGRSVVVFEYLSYQGREVCLHADISSEGQTVTFKTPSIRTSASGAGSEKEIIVSDKVTIIDRITYENLAVGKTFVVKGKLMDKSTGGPLLIDGKEVLAETTFTTEKASGTVDVTFIFDASALYGKKVVVFEKLYYADSDIEIAVHEDISDKNQSVTFVSLVVLLTKTNSADNSLLDGAEFVLKDANDTEVKLTKGSDGIYYPDENGNAVITTDGGKALICGLSRQVYTITETKAPADFEGYFEPVALDLDDKNTADSPFQVTIMNAPEGGKSGVGAKTGGDGLPMWMLYVGIAAAAAGVVAVIALKKKKRNSLAEG